MARTLADAKTSSGHYERGDYDLKIYEITGLEPSGNNLSPRLQIKTTFVGGKYDGKGYVFWRSLTPAAEPLLAAVFNAAGLGNLELPTDFTLDSWMAAAAQLRDKIVRGTIAVEANERDPAAPPRNEVYFRPPFDKGEYDFAFFEVTGIEPIGNNRSPRLQFKTTFVGGKYADKKFVFWRSLTPAAERLITDMLKAAGLAETTELPDEGDYTLASWLPIAKTLVDKTVRGRIDIQAGINGGVARNEVYFNPPRVTNGSAAHVADSVEADEDAEVPAI
jgi:hypothetical protein